MRSTILTDFEVHNAVLSAIHTGCTAYIENSLILCNWNVIPVD